MKPHRTAVQLVLSTVLAVALLAMLGAAPVRDSQLIGRQEALRRSGAVAQGKPFTGPMILALGDSVPAGAACDCHAFPAVYASMVKRRTGAPLTVRNDAVSGLDTTGLLEQLQEPLIAAAVRRANVVLVTIGANDFEEQHDRVVDGACNATAGADCVSDQIESMRSHLARALAEIRDLRQGKPTSVLVTGYWNVFQDGAVARQAFGARGLQAAISLTRRVNAAISSLSTAAGARYVDLFEPFQRRGRDIDSLLAPDGDHPNAAGHQLIARALLDAGLPSVA